MGIIYFNESCMECVGRGEFKFLRLARMNSHRVLSYLGICYSENGHVLWEPEKKADYLSSIQSLFQ